VHASLRHLSCVDSSICPDCLYRHPIWKAVEADAEVMEELRKMEEDFNARVERAAAGEGLELELGALPAGAAEANDIWLHRDLDEEEKSDSDDESAEAARQQFLIARQRSIMRAASQRKLSVGAMDTERSSRSGAAMLTVRVTAPEPRRMASSAGASAHASSARKSSATLSPVLGGLSSRRVRDHSSVTVGSPSSGGSVASADDDVVIRFHLDAEEEEAPPVATPAAAKK